MPPTLSLASVQLSYASRQSAAVRDFYRRILGLRELDGEGRQFSFALGNATLLLSPVARLERPLTADVLALRTEAYEQVLERLRAAGHHPVCSAPGAPRRVMYVKDPGGNQLALVG